MVSGVSIAEHAQILEKDIKVDTKHKRYLPEYLKSATILLSVPVHPEFI